MVLILVCFLAWLSIVYLPFAMGNWCAFTALCASYLLVGFGVRYGVATYTAAEVPAILVLIGDIWIDFVVRVLPITVGARAVVLAAKSLGFSGRRLLVANVIGILALPGTAIGLDLHQRWEKRPASSACTDRPILLSLSGIDGSVPWSKAISLYLGANTREDARYLFVPRHRRSICRDTADGVQPLMVTALSIKPDRVRSDRCMTSDILPWEQTICAEAEDRRTGFSTLAIVFFDPNGIRPGDFGIEEAPTNYDYPLADDERLVVVADPAIGTVTAVCRPQPNPTGWTHCQMRRPIIDGIDFYWEISTSSDAVEDRLLRAETFARSVCWSVFALPACAVHTGKHP